MSFTTDVLKKCLEQDMTDINIGIGEANTIREAAGYQLQCNLLKKFSSTVSSDQADMAAIKKFIACNDACKEWRLPVDGIERIILDRAKAIMAKNFTTFDGYAKFNLQDVGNLSMVGPGASRFSAGNDLWSKLFHGPVSATHPKLYRWYKATVGWNDHWDEAEFVRAKSFGDHDNHNTQGNKMFFVPKDAIISRPACTEPTLNMFFQKGIGEAICKYILPFHGIDLECQQDKNKWFAKSGSLNDYYSTIDLQSASDTISWDLVQYMLPERVVSMLDLTRSKLCETPFGVIKLNMVSTMGNGFTFPLQTWLFAALTQATYETLGYPVKDPCYSHARQYSVFGDDIICVAPAYNLLVRVLHAAGFQVNIKKSYSHGPFRESCGGDFFKGHNVRAVYFKEYSLPSHIYSVINRLSLWSARHKILLPKTFEYLLSWVPFRPVPLYEELTSGICTPRESLRVRKSDADGNYIYHPLRPQAEYLRLDEATCEKFSVSTLIAFLHGSMSCRSMGNKNNVEQSFGVFISRRSFVTKYKSVRESSVISWNFLPDPGVTARDYVLSWNDNIKPFVEFGKTRT